MPDNFKGRFHRYSAVVSILASEYEAVINQMNDARKFNGCYSSHDYSTLARAYSHLGKPDEATLYIDSAKATASSFSDQGNIYIALSELADRNDKDEANKYLRLYLQLIEPKMDSIIASPIENLTIDFYNDEIKQENAIRAKYNTIMILSITILVLILIFLSHRLYKRKISIHLQKERIQQLVLELEAIKDAQKEFSLGKNDFYQTLESNLKTIELIGEQYFRDSKSSYPSENTSKIKEIIDSFGSDSMISKLEKVINENHPGLIDEVKANYPKMSGKQKMLLYYSILGLSSEAICAIVSIKEMNALYALRSRLRKTLASNPSSSYDLLVSILKIAK